MSDETVKPADRQWVISWRWDDGSSSGVLPLLFTDQEREKLDFVLCELGSQKDYKFVEVTDTPP